AAEEDPSRVELLGPPLRLLPDLRRHLFELPRREHREAAALALGHERAVGELVPVLRREDDPPLGVQGVLELSQEHPESLASRSSSAPSGHLVRPVRGDSRAVTSLSHHSITTSLHFVAPYTPLPHSS